jgi:hypothetical protein
MASLSDAQLEFLKKFRQGVMSERDIVHYVGNSGWEAVLGSSITLVIQAFKRDNLIHRLSPDSDLILIAASKLRSPDLKKFLSARNAKVSGTKDQLVHRCIELDFKAVQAMIPEDTYWATTEHGDALVDEHLGAKLAAQSKCEDDVLALLSINDYASAAKRRAAYNASLTFSPGMGCSWTDWDIKRDVEVVKYIYEQCPLALTLLHPGDVSRARPLAAVMYLFGGKVSARLYSLVDERNPDVIGGKSRKHQESIARLLQFYAIGRANLRQWKAEGIKAVKVASCDDSCEGCKQLSKRSHQIDNAPQLPYSLCTSSCGCRCCYLPEVR